jgi:hypothetical protein
MWDTAGQEVLYAISPPSSSFSLLPPPSLFHSIPLCAPKTKGLVGYNHDQPYRDPNDWKVRQSRELIIGEQPERY